jgi:hypothetical protein
VSEVEPSVFNALLSQLATATENLGPDSAPNDDLAVRFTDVRGGAERVHDLASAEMGAAADSSAQMRWRATLVARCPALTSTVDPEVLAGHSGSGQGCA